MSPTTLPGVTAVEINKHRIHSSQNIRLADFPTPDELFQRNSGSALPPLHLSHHSVRFQLSYSSITDLQSLVI